MILLLLLLLLLMFLLLLWFSVSWSHTVTVAATVCFMFFSLSLSLSFSLCSTDRQPASQPVSPAIFNIVYAMCCCRCRCRCRRCCYYFLLLLLLLLLFFPPSIHLYDLLSFERRFSMLNSWATNFIVCVIILSSLLLLGWFRTWLPENLITLCKAFIFIYSFFWLFPLCCFISLSQIQVRVCMYHSWVWVYLFAVKKT